MKIPVFEELFFEEFTSEYIYEKLLESRIGKVPTFINLTNLKTDDRSQIINLLRDNFLTLNLSPKFPYPCYLIAENLLDDFFPVCVSVKELPDHFFKKVKRPNNKEIQLLNKLSLKVEKIKNLEMNDLFETIKDTKLSQRKLYTLTKELYFLEILNYRIIEREKERQKNGKKTK